MKFLSGLFSLITNFGSIVELLKTLVRWIGEGVRWIQNKVAGKRLEEGIQKAKDEKDTSKLEDLLRRK